MESMKAVVDSVSDTLARRPVATLVVSHALTSAAFLYVLSEGKPLQYLKKKLFQVAMAAVPASVVQGELNKVKKTIEESIIGHHLDGEKIIHEIPATGWTKSAIIDELQHYGTKDSSLWRSGRMSGCVYHGGDDLSAIMSEAFQRFALSNPLHPDVFPSVRKMEAEVVAMTVKLFNGGADACGTMTSGGTESILMAMKAYRDFAKATRGITDPELVVPVTAHAAFDKACDYFKIKLVHVPVDPHTFRADVKAMKAATTKNTIAIVASAPCFPQGVIDPIEDLGAFASARGIPMHVDCCLGSFLIAFAESIGHKVPKFDFRVAGVTSISADTHKYGFAPKGSSVVMYADNKYRHAQYFVAADWTGGIYASPSIAGSRPGALIAACWATMVSTGRDGYEKSFRKILGAAKTIRNGVASIPELTLCGEPDLSVICFQSAHPSKLNIYNIGDEMSSRGWNLNTLQNPPSLHICVTYANAGQASRFVEDLGAAVLDVIAAPPGKYKNGSGAIYGMAASIPDRSIVNEVAYSFLDTLYKADQPE